MLKSLRDYFLTFIIAGIVFAVVAYFMVGFVLKSISPEVPTDPSDTTIDPGIIDSPTDKSSSFNVLVIGIDYQPDILSDYSKEKIDSLFPGNGYVSTMPTLNEEMGLVVPNYRKVNADSVMLLRVDKKNKEFTYTVLPSNMVLTVGGIMTTLKDLYCDKGLDFVIDKVHAITGLPIDYYAVVNIAAAAEIIDMFDGISYAVPCNMQYSDSEQNLNISLKAGLQDLTGRQALDMLRFNNYTDAVNSRAKTMLSFAKEMIAKMTGVMYVSKLPEAFAKASKMIKTNFTADDFANNINLIAAYPSLTVKELTYPGTYSTSDSSVSFIPNITQALKYFESYQRD